MQRAFRLQSILQLRRMAEESQQRVLAKARQELLTATNLLDRFEQAVDECIVDVQELYSDSLNIRLINEYSNYIQWMQKVIQHQKTCIEQLSSHADQEQYVLAEATKQRKIIEALAEKHEKIYQSWLFKLEQKMLDEVASQMHERRRTDERPIPM